MNWAQWICTNQVCGAEVWMVRRDPAVSDAWEVAAHVDDRPFLVAATEPICPRCGTTLCLPARLAHHVDDDVLEIGKVPAFVRSMQR
jgi:ribosomal protein S27AE